MKYYSAKSIGARLQQAEEAIIIAQAEADINEVLVSRGYTEGAFLDGAARVAAVKAIDTQKREQLGLQVVATAEVERAYRTLRISFTTDRRIVRLATFDNPEYIDQLRLNQRVSSAAYDFVLQAAHFYNKVKEYPDVMALMQERYNIGEEVIDARIADVAELEETIRKQQVLIGGMRKVTQERREAMALVDAWMKPFIATARIAFQNDPGSLNKLGILMRTR